MPPSSPSGSGEPRTLKQDRAYRTRRHVLRAAAEMFAELGYTNTSITGIAEHIGMTKGAVYFHYKNKDAMAVEVVQDAYRIWGVLTEEVTAESQDPATSIMTLLDRTVQTFLDDVIVQAGSRLQAERSLIDARLPEPYVGWTNRLTQLFEQAAEAGDLRPGVTPRAAATAVVAAVFGMQHISDVLHQRQDLAERWAELRTVLVETLLTPR
ncbi:MULTISPECIES: ScbR family autoregulator-binding transcription factor [unclassified Streptomyces]|uniref:ScbR family autoregulator-binding transcription factor n=1 Tax=unclassified Streptomyces TaxID=2593676 RepID=UPI0036F88970